MVCRSLTPLVTSATAREGGTDRKEKDSKEQKVEHTPLVKRLLGIVPG